ncbi:uncharacterized protein LOC114251735 [Bombyx mandarina]|uniref:Uncharacterized protein LOC114251735 n=1 Tax=Bombyx mandarina TaxID=7092 RepID=A0A6J2KHU6_BOMMA|nr:uncharacterized protein LOC114251735 [Bombyx mandarina]
MAGFVLIVLAGLTCAVLCKPVEDTEKANKKSFLFTGTFNEALPNHHDIERRFINPLFNLGGSYNLGNPKLRTRRSEVECEKLALCKLHARSRQNFFAAYELYFINKENARYWDHRARTAAECEQRYGDCDAL